MEAISSGIGEIDRLLGGYLVRGKVYLLEADNGTQPQGIVLPFIDNALKTNELVIYACNERPAEEVLDQLREYQIEVDTAIAGKQLLLLDLWSEGEINAPGIIGVGNPADPHKVMYSYQQVYQFAMERKPRIPFRIVTDSLSGSVMTFGFDRAYRLASRATRLMKLGHSVGLAVVVPKMHEQFVSESFERLHDGVIRLILKEESDRVQRYFRVLKSPLPGFQGQRTPYEHTSKGFEMSVDLIDSPPEVRAHLSMIKPGVLELSNERVVITSFSILNTILRDLALSFNLEALLPVLTSAAHEAFHQVVLNLLEIFKGQEAHEKLAGFLKLMGLVGLGRMQVAYDEDDAEFNVTLEDSPFSFSVGDLGISVDFIHAAMLSNLFEAVYKTPYIAEEVLCVEKGDPHCEFRVYPAKKTK
ncbi:MAG: ATPase domain-containing protein [Candidatus Hermodarchaeota archaeon]|nr:ATPase domain-containing protein [Candidatus Hermodarchaeota archaeon]